MSSRLARLAPIWGGLEVALTVNQCLLMDESRHSAGLTVAIASVSGEERPYGETTTDRDADPDADLSDRAGGRRHDGGP